MGRRQVIVQLDDDLVSALDQVAETEGVSRSELLRRGAAAVLKAHDLSAKEKRHIEGYRKIPQEPLEGEALFQMAREALDDW